MCFPICPFSFHWKVLSLAQTSKFSSSFISMLLAKDVASTSKNSRNGRKDARAVAAFPVRLEVECSMNDSSDKKQQLEAGRLTLRQDG